MQNITAGDIVRLKQPYKVEDFRQDKLFIAAINGGHLPVNPAHASNIYSQWSGFYYGIVNQILSKDSKGGVRNLSLFLYYAAKEEAWLMYKLGNGVPTFVDFHVSEVELIHKSSAANYALGEVKS